MNYYNENDPKAAAWLKSLIKEGLIPKGIVDERSITEVNPSDLAGYTQHHFFAGIAGWPLALQLAGWPTNREVWTGSCPCQPFSTAGKRKGNQDERHLWPVWCSLLRRYNAISKRKPVPVFGEQVAAAIRHGWLDGVCTDLEGEGYAVGHAVLGAHSVGAPHIRQRLYWMADCDTNRRYQERAGVATAGDDGINGNGTVDRMADCISNRRGTGWRKNGSDDWNLSATGGGSERMECSIRSENDATKQGQQLSGKRCDSTDRIRSAVQGSGEVGAGGVEITKHGRRERRNQTQGHITTATLPSGEGLGESFQSRLEGLTQPSDGSHQSRWNGTNTTGSTAKAGAISGLAHARHSTAGTEQGNELQECDSRVGQSGHWNDFDLIPCRDGKARRVKSGVRCLAHGVSGRVAQLRGLGNAIVPQVAAEFIKAFLETEAEVTT